MKRRKAAKNICAGCLILASFLWVGSVATNAAAYLGRGNDEVYVALDEGRIEVGWDHTGESSGDWDIRGAHWELGVPEHGNFTVFAHLEGELMDFPQAAWASIPLWVAAFVAGLCYVIMTLTKRRKEQIKSNKQQHHKSDRAGELVVDWRRLRDRSK